MGNATNGIRRVWARNIWPWRGLQQEPPHPFGLPEKKDLPSTFSIEYIRAWKQVGQK